MKKVCYLRVLPEYDNKRAYALKGNTNINFKQI